MGFIDLHKPLMDLIPDDYKLSMAEDILEGITGRSDKPPIYIPRGYKMG